MLTPGESARPIPAENKRKYGSAPFLGFGLELRSRLYPKSEVATFASPSDIPSDENPPGNSGNGQAEDIRRIFSAEDRPHAEAKLAEFIETCGKTALKLANWAEQNIPQGLTVFSFPEASRQRLRTSNMCEAPNSQIKRRTRVVCLFPNEFSLLRLVTGILIEISEEWEANIVYFQP